MFSSPSRGLLSMTSLQDLYTRWATLTQAERDAIRAHDWTALSKRQNEKQALMGEISRQPQPSSGNLRPLLTQLVKLEEESAVMLAEEKRLVIENQRALRHAGRTLQQVHQAYSAQRSPIWNSYS